MWLYIVIFLFIAYLGVNGKGSQLRTFRNIMIFLALFVGFSDMLGGYDRYIYCDLFDQMAYYVHNGISIFRAQIWVLFGSEFGYCFWNFVVAHITENRYVFILVTTILMYFLFYRAIKQQTENPMLALVIFMALTFFFTFTYLRQMLSAAIAWQAIQYIRKRNLLMYSLWMFIAFSFHNSAIIIYPLYFIVLRKYSIIQVAVLLLVCLVIGASGASSAIFDTYSNIDATRLAHADYTDEKGLRWAYLIEALFFCYFIFRYYSVLIKDKKALPMMNMSIIFCAILLLFINSENGGRLGWYCMIGLYGMMSTIYKRVPATRFVISIVCFILYLRILLSWGFMLYPYKSCLTNGVREGDLAEQIYEYDHRYDFDKFYKK